MTSQFCLIFACLFASPSSLSAHEAILNVQEVVLGMQLGDSTNNRQILIEAGEKQNTVWEVFLRFEEGTLRVYEIEYQRRAHPIAGEGQVKFEMRPSLPRVVHEAIDRDLDGRIDLIYSDLPMPGDPPDKRPTWWEIDTTYAFILGEALRILRERYGTPRES